VLNDFADMLAVENIISEAFIEGICEGIGVAYDKGKITGDVLG
jgi:hypothetical protein